MITPLIITALMIAATWMLAVGVKFIRRNDHRTYGAFALGLLLACMAAWLGVFAVPMFRWQLLALAATGSVIAGVLWWMLQTDHRLVEFRRGRALVLLFTGLGIGALGGVLSLAGVIFGWLQL